MSVDPSRKTSLKAPLLVLVSLAATVLMLVANPTEALAGEARVDASALGAKLVYEDATNNSQDNNDVKIGSPSFGTYTVHDAGEPVSAGPGCTATANAYTVTCSDVRINSILVDVWRGPDKVTINVGTSATIYTGSGEDTIHGGSANDTIHSDRSCLVSDAGCTTRTIENSGIAGIFDDVVDGNDGNDVIEGGTGDDELHGGSGDDTIDGDAPDLVTPQDGSCDYCGDDLLNGGSGADQLWGNEETDTADYSERTAGVTVTLDGQANDGAPGEGDSVGRTVGWTYDIERVVGGGGNDSLTGDHHSNHLQGRGGPDSLDGGGGPDSLDGGDGPDSLYGGEHNDTLVPGAGAGDGVVGGNGADLASYSDRTAAVNVSLDGNANDGVAGENDNVVGDVEAVAGGSGGDTLTGGTYGATLYGNGGNDTLRGGSANDRLEGEGGDDSLDGGAGPDHISGGDGTDIADYTGREQGVVVSLGNSLTGSADDGEAGEGDDVEKDVETVLGGSGGDTLYAAPEFGSTLVGNGGNDQLGGGLGADTLRGGGGQDSFDPTDGDDDVRARDGVEEEVSCGLGADLASVDSVDTAAEDCETVEVADPPSLAIDDPTVTEGTITGDGTAARAVFTVSLSAPADETVNAAYTTADGTALAEEDYKQVEGTLTFAPGDTTEKISVPVVDDEDPEPAESFHVDLFNASGEADKNRGTATIADDDNRLDIDDVTVTEGNDGTMNARFTVGLSVEASGLVAVSYATTDGTATAPDDYAATSGTLTFAAGDSTGTIAVPVVGDRLDEPDEAFAVELSSVRGAEIGDGQGQGPIADDDPPPDTSLPETTITGGPSGLTADDTPTFAFDGSDDRTARANLTFSYRVDSGGWSAYSSATSVTLASLPDGPHTFYVRARDEAGNEDASPAERSFTVDTTAPTVKSAAPTGKKVSRRANVAVAFSEAVEASTVDGTTFELVKKGANTPVGATVEVSPDGKSAKLDPAQSLKRGATYVATVTVGVEDPAGNALDQDPATTGDQPKTWSFRVRR